MKHIPTILRLLLIGLVILAIDCSGQVEYITEWDFIRLSKDTSFIQTQAQLGFIETPNNEEWEVTVTMKKKERVVITNTYDDQNPFVQYFGSWTKATGTKDPYYLNTCTYSNNTSAYFTVNFTGELQMWSATASHHGKMGVSHNGGPEVVLDMKSATRVHDVMIFNALGGGTVKVRVISGYCVTDYFKEIR